MRPLLSTLRLAFHRLLPSCLALLPFLPGPLAAGQPLPLEGVIADEAGQPLAGASVDLLPLPAEAEIDRLLRTGRDTVPAAASARTDAEGRFRLAAPGAGMWIALASAPGRATMARQLVPLVEPASLGMVRLPEDETVEVRVLDPGGRPVVGARVDAAVWEPLGTGFDETRHAYDWHLAGASSRTDSGGRVTLHRSPRTALDLSIRAPGFLPAARERVDAPAVDLRLVAGDPPRSPALVSGSIRLSGRVLDGAGRRPIAGAFVWASNDPGAAVRSDAAGRYSLPIRRTLPPGVSAAAPDTIAVSERLEPTPRRARSGGALAGPTFRLGQSSTLRGTVVDEAGVPLAGARVSILPPADSGWGCLWSSGAVRTSQDGSFRLRLSAQQPVLLYATAARSGASALPLSGLRPGEERTGLRVVLRPAPRLTARVTDEEGHPLAGARAVVFPTGRSDETPAERLDGRDAPFLGEGDGEGRLRVDKIPSGLFELYLTAPGFAPYFRERIESPPATDRELDLGAIALKPGLTVRGVVVDPAGRPIAGAAIRSLVLSPRQGSLWMAYLGDSRPRLRSGPDGMFEVRDLGSDTQALLTIEREGYERTQVESRPPSGGGMERVVLRPTYALRGTVRDEAGRPVPGAVLVGRVTGPDGGARSGVRIELNRLAAGSYRISPPVATTGADGGFRLAGLETGTWRLNAGGDGIVTAEREVEIRPGENRVEVELEASLSLAGRVLDSEGRPAGQAQVLADGEHFSISTGTRDDGRFRFDELPPGAYEVRASHTLFASAEPVRVELRAGAQGPLDLRLRPGGELRGRVSGPPPERLAEVTVEASLSGPGGGEKKRARLTAGGEYRLAGLEAGDWSVAALLGLRLAERKVTLGGAGTETALDLELPMGEALEGRLTLDGEPLPKVVVYTLAANGRMTGVAQTGPGGEFRIEGLAPGAHRLLVGYEDPSGSKVPPSREVTIPAAEPLAIELRRAP